MLEDKTTAWTDLLESALAVLGPPGNSMIEKHAPIPEQGAYLGKVGWEVGNTNMLIHADTCNFIVFTIQITVVAQVDGHPAFQT